MRRAAILAVLLLPAAASAQSLRLLDTLVLEYRGDNGNAQKDDDDYFVGLNKLYLIGESEGLSARAQIDASLFNPTPDVANPTPSDPSAYKSEARLERISAAWALDEDLTLSVGDFHQQIGRGIALSVRRVDELGTDQALRGGSLAWEGDRLGGIVFAGRTNVANVDPVTLRYVPDPEDTIAGARGTWHLGRTDLSVYGVFLQSATPFLIESGEDRAAIGGAYLELPAFDWLQLYVEGAGESYNIASTEKTGTALYGTADLDLQLVSLLLEGIFLDEFVVQGSQNELLDQRTSYNLPPTLERIDMEVLDNQDVRGLRARVSRALLDGDLVLYVNGMFRRFGREERVEDAVHGYAGFELLYGGGSSRWNASGGYRQEVMVETGEEQKSMVHAESDWLQDLGDLYAVHLTVIHQSRSQIGDDGGAVESIRGTTLLGLERGGLGSLTAEVGYDTGPTSPQDLFLAGIVGWEAADWVTLRTVVGSQRGGLKCIGGVCRDFPAFTGARFEASFATDLM